MKLIVPLINLPLFHLLWPKQPLCLKGLQWLFYDPHFENLTTIRYLKTKSCYICPTNNTKVNDFSEINQTGSYSVCSANHHTTNQGKIKILQQITTIKTKWEQRMWFIHKTGLFSNNYLTSAPQLKGVLFNSQVMLQSVQQKSCLRTVPTIVIAHSFCASPDTLISYRQCLLIQGYFCVV